VTLRQQWLAMTDAERRAFGLDALRRKDRALIRELLDAFHRRLSEDDEDETGGD
jgi:hypothetical protein